MAAALRDLPFVIRHPELQRAGPAGRIPPGDRRCPLRV